MFPQIKVSLSRKREREIERERERGRVARMRYIIIVYKTPADSSGTIPKLNIYFKAIDLLKF